MANTVKTKSKLKENKNKMLLSSIFSLIFAIMFLIATLVVAFYIIFNKSDISPFVALVLFIVSLILFGFFAYSKKQYSILRSGVKGENRTYRILNNLSENFTLLSNPMLYSRGRKAELDFVVIGSDAIFIIESKNHKGILRGSCEDNEWTQIKERGEKTYTKTIKNPLKQSLKQVKMFTDCLTDSGISAAVFPVVYFADSDVSIESDWDASNMIRVIKDEKELISYIVNTKGNIAIDENAKQKIIDLLTNQES